MKKQKNERKIKINISICIPDQTKYTQDLPKYVFKSIFQPK